MRRFYAEYLLCAATILLLFGSGVLGAQTIAKELTGKLVALNGRITGPSNNPAVGQAKYIALYYGAGWCGPCHKFTPDLVAFYNEMKPKYPDFEVVFVSRDTSAAEMDNYMVEMKMPWPALRYDAVKWSTKLNKYCGPGIPCLVVVNANGDVLSDSYNGSNYLGPHKALDGLRTLLAQGGPAISTSSPVGAVSPAPARTGTPPSPSGTNWEQVFKKKSP